MKSNKELRQEAWIIVRGKWFWRLLVVGAALQGIAQLVNSLMKSSFKQMEIMTYGDFLETKLRMMQQGLTYSLPSTDTAFNMFGATVFQCFVVYIFAAILAFGFASVSIKATKNDEQRWFSDSFNGFKRPLEVAWLMALMNLKVFLWSLMFIFPGIVALYRYRQAWYLKSDNHEWSASKCLIESGKLMKGNKWKAFTFDLSYIGWLIVSWFALGIAIGLGAFANQSIIIAVLSSIAGIGALYFVLFIIIYFFTGRAVFYKEVSREHCQENEHT